MSQGKHREHRWSRNEILTGDGGAANGRIVLQVTWQRIRQISPLTFDSLSELLIFKYLSCCLLFKSIVSELCRDKIQIGC